MWAMAFLKLFQKLNFYISTADFPPLWYDGELTAVNLLRVRANIKIKSKKKKKFKYQKYVSFYQLIFSVEGRFVKNAILLT